MFFAYIWLAVIVATSAGCHWLFNWGILGERLAGFAGWFWYDERLKFIEVAVLARVASDEEEAAVAMLLSSDASIEILLSHFFWFNVRWHDWDDLLLEKYSDFGGLPPQTKYKCTAASFEQIDGQWQMPQFVNQSNSHCFFGTLYICPFSISTLKNSSSGYLADTSTNNNTNYHHRSPKKMDACFLQQQMPHAREKDV